MRVKAEAMQQWGKAAIIQMILESLPGFAAEVAQPLDKIEEIVVLGGKNEEKSNDKADILNMFNAFKLYINGDAYIFEFVHLFNF